MRPNLPALFLFSCIVAVAPCWTAVAEEDQEKVDFFESHIRPLLIEHCYECHSSESKEAGGGLLLDSQPAMQQGGERGNVLMGANLESTLLWKAISYSDPELQMPPKGKLQEEKLLSVRKWLEDGAIDPRKSATMQPSKRVSLSEKAMSHWAYQPIQSPAIPSVLRKDWVRNSIDSFVLSRLEKQNLAPNPIADKRVLIRRLYFDLIGLPPSSTDIATFEADDEEGAYERLVDRLMSSPRLGERFARYWMDLGRYADTKGYVFQENREYPHAYRYRDWLIRSFNEDMPYDQFVRYQLAADRLDPKNESGNLDAMGLLTLGRRFLNNQHDIADDRIDVVSRGLLAVTVGCARCHDHKFDAVDMSDYYSLHGVFVNSDEPGGDPSPLRLVDRAEQKPSFIFLRGQPGNRGPKIDRTFLRFLSGNTPRPLADGSGRIDLANAIVDRNNPLTARVYVNRLWGWLTGMPFVDSTSDFGLRCESPHHRDLLDHLAYELMESGWHTKSLVRRIVMSATYRQSSQNREDALSIDPENHGIWKFNRRRMDFEAFRDAILFATHHLDSSIGGTSIKIHEAPFQGKRTVYAYIDRQNLPGLFRSFDFANPDSHSPRRSMTTVPQQGLFVLNSGMVRVLSKELSEGAQRVLYSSSADRDEHRQPIDVQPMTLEQMDRVIGFLFDSILSRHPTKEEFSWAREYLQSNAQTIVSQAPQTYWSYGSGQLTLNPFRLESFEAMNRFENGSWKRSEAGSKASLDENGGQPGTTLNEVVVRRWTAKKEGNVRIEGNLQHSQDKGDGIRASIFVNGQRLLQQWTCKNNKQRTRQDEFFVSEGDWVDFVVDSIEDSEADGFRWSVSITTDGTEAGTFKSKDHFSGTEIPREFDVIAQLAQALLATNEFLFID